VETIVDSRSNISALRSTLDCNTSISFVLASWAKVAVPVMEEGGERTRYLIETSAIEEDDALVTESVAGKISASPLGLPFILSILASSCSILQSSFSNIAFAIGSILGGGGGPTLGAPFKSCCPFCCWCCWTSLFWTFSFLEEDMLCGDPALFAASEGMKLLANMLDSEFSIFEGQKDENLFYSCFLFSPEFFPRAVAVF